MKIKDHWIDASKKCPDVDNSDEWNRLNQITPRVITYSKIWGIKFGQYFGLAKIWNIDGVSSSSGIEVEYWMPIPENPKI